MQVLLHSGQERRIVTARVEADQTAAVLKACIAEQEHLDPSSVTHPLVFAGKEVPDSEQLEQLSLMHSSATIQSCGTQLFPNGWFDSPFSKAFVKVQDITWPPVRQADFTVTIAWVVALLVLLLWTQGGSQ